MGVRLELPHEDLPRAETALSSCLCLGEGEPPDPCASPLPGIVPSALAPCDRAGAHKCFGFCSVHVQAAPTPHTECTAGSALRLPAAVLLLGQGPAGQGGSALHPQFLLPLSALPPGQVCLPCLNILPACPCCQLGGWGAASPSPAPPGAREGGCPVLYWLLFPLLRSSWQTPLLVSPLAPPALCPPPLSLPPTRPHST